jgi:hypothetical protein
MGAPSPGALSQVIAMPRRIPKSALALVLLLVTGASCTGDTVAGVAPAPAAPLLGLPLGGSGGPSLLQCEPPAAADSVTGVIGLLGGTLQLGNTKVVIPQNAVLSPTTFRLRIPASRYVEISVSADGVDHYVFQQPVLVTIDYGRCASGLSLLDPVTAWWIDESTKAPIQQMLGVDLRLTHTIAFYTGHFTGYAIAD